ncbi:hypothetical protein F5Y15DRAFT_413801 [Xylariaceae sp. FL0016]|nr:hypothetical protein F5Y15DRAFT_413801 [Xylariaceae sp. FL0016]
MASTFNLPDQNISYFTVHPSRLRLGTSVTDHVHPAALAMASIPSSTNPHPQPPQALAPRFYSGIAGPGKKHFDRSNPRNFSARLNSADIDKELRQRLLRAESCVANAFEGLPLFAAGVVAANAAGLPTSTVNALSLGYVASRVAYTWVYIWGQNNRRLSGARTLVWMAGMGMIMTMFVKAGLKS